jgi:hypothetical protein
MEAQRIILCTVASVLCVSTIGFAQGTARRPGPRKAGEPRFVFSVSGGVQSPAASGSDQVQFERNADTETINVTYPDKVGVLVDVGFGALVWKRLGIGVAVSHATASGTADVNASIPHPFFFQMRTVTGQQSGMSRDETGVHLQAQYVIPASRSVRVVLGAGPSWIALTEDVVSDVTIIETYPYDTAQFSSAVTNSANASAIGFNAGADVTWHLNRAIGFGGLVRYTRANLDLDVREGHVRSMKAGGIQGAAGVRFAF